MGGTPEAWKATMAGSEAEEDAEDRSAARSARKDSSSNNSAKHLWRKDSSNNVGAAEEEEAEAAEDEEEEEVSEADMRSALRSAKRVGKGVAASELEAESGPRQTRTNSR